MTITNDGQGKDRKGTKRDGLRLRWRWLMRRELSGGSDRDHRRLPCQTCFAEKRTSHGLWRYCAIDWHDGYEAEVSFNGNHFISSERDLPTRLDAQRCAEGLVASFCGAAIAENV